MNGLEHGVSAGLAAAAFVILGILLGLIVVQILEVLWLRAKSVSAACTRWCSAWASRALRASQSRFGQ